MTSDKMPQFQVLHLAGSPISDFYFNLSIIYAREVVHPAGVSSEYAVVHPDGLWQLGPALNQLSEKISFREVVPNIPRVDVVVPHMFCMPGMTSFRGLFEDALGLPVVGSTGNCAALTMDKAQTRSVVAAAGVTVAKAQQVRRGDTITMQPPFIVKPNCEDNSIGVSLVREWSELDDALRIGFANDDALLVEEYIPGREMRVGIIEHNGKLQVLPLIEYLFSADQPIRTLQDKLELQQGLPKKQNPVDTVCPAQCSKQLLEKISTAAQRAHAALGCRDYSLYDFRIHEETSEPYLLEAGLFWSFGKISVLSRMLQGADKNVDNMVLSLWQAAAKRGPGFNGWKC